MTPRHRHRAAAKAARREEAILRNWQFLLTAPPKRRDGKPQHSALAAGSVPPNLRDLYGRGPAVVGVWSGGKVR